MDSKQLTANAAIASGITWNNYLKIVKDMGATDFHNGVKNGNPFGETDPVTIALKSAYENGYTEAYLIKVNG